MVTAIPGTIQFWFDFSSPYGYFASHRIGRIAADAGRSVVWKPFMLASVFKETGARPMLEVPLKGTYCLHDWDRLGRLYGLPWALPERFPIAATAATRAFYWIEANAPELAERFARACFDAYYGAGRNLMRAEVLASIAEALGIDSAALLAAVEQPQWKERAKDEGSEAVRRGVVGSPYFIADGEGFWGHDRLDMLAEWLRRGTW